MSNKHPQFQITLLQKYLFVVSFAELQLSFDSGIVNGCGYYSLWKRGKTREVTLSFLNIFRLLEALFRRDFWLLCILQ